MRSLIAPGCLLAVCALQACEERSEPAASVPPPASAPAATMDWAGIKATNDGGQIIAYKSLARQCDGWYKGSKEAVILHFEPGGTVRADDGRSTRVAAPDWKGIVTDSRKNTALEALAAPSSIYATGGPGMPRDSFGKIPRYKYQMQVVDDSTIRFVNQGKYDDGR